MPRTRNTSVLNPTLQRDGWTVMNSAQSRTLVRKRKDVCNLSSRLLPLSNDFFYWGDGILQSIFRKIHNSCFLSSRAPVDSDWDVYSDDELAVLRHSGQNTERASCSTHTNLHLTSSVFSRRAKNVEYFQVEGHRDTKAFFIELRSKRENFCVSFSPKYCIEQYLVKVSFTSGASRLIFYLKVFKMFLLYRDK